MITPSIPISKWFYYPVGNTPAVSLTRAIPRSDSATVLSLGCGDPRNLLFTVFSEPDRKLDFTVCDYSDALLCRNILILTLILDDKSGENQETIFDISYNFYLCLSSSKILKDQAEKLVALTADKETWASSKYGNIILFGDQHTFDTISRGFQIFSQPITNYYKQSFAMFIKRSQRIYNNEININTVNFSGIQALSPYGVQECFEDYWQKLCKSWWTYGTLEQLPSLRHQATLPNPLFSPFDDAGVLHYGTTPLVGFHLGLAFLPVDKSSYTPKDEGHHGKAGRVINMAKAQHAAWSKAFSGASEHIKYRVVHADALAFAMTLQHANSTGGSELSANWYRNRFSFIPMSLTGGDYEKKGLGGPPLTFDSIDTSNLIDHLGPLNLLVAAGPLLSDNGGASALVIESIVTKGLSREQRLQKMFGVNVNIISGLLGLTLVDWVTNSEINSDGYVTLKSQLALDHNLVVMPLRLIWRRVANGNNPIAKIKIIKSDLISLLNVIRGEIMLEDKTFDIIKGSPYYNRLSFLAIWAAIKSRLDLSGLGQYLPQLFPKSLLDIADYEVFSSESMMYEELLTLDDSPHFYKPDIPGFEVPATSSKRTDIDSGLVCVTIAVPRSDVRKLIDIQKSLTLALQVNHEPSNHAFTVLQIGFGEISLEIASGLTRINIKEDPNGIAGNSDMIVSFLVPRIYIEKGICFSLSCLLSSGSFMTAFLKGCPLEFGQYYLSAPNVFYTRHFPNIMGPPKLTIFSPHPTSPVVVTTNAEMTVQASISDGDVENLKFLFSFTVQSAKDALRRGDTISVTSQSPLHHILSLNPEIQVPFVSPIALDIERLTVDILQASDSVTVTGFPAEKPDWRARLSTRTYLDSRKIPVPWNLPCVGIDMLPVLKIQDKSLMDWLPHELEATAASSEYRIRDGNIYPLDPNSTPKQVMRQITMTSSLIFRSYANITDIKHWKSFLLRDLNNRTDFALVLVSALRWDLSSHAPLLDMACIPLTTENRDYGKLKFVISQMEKKSLLIFQSALEISQWQNIWPAFVERCRTWEHEADCEYKAGCIKMSNNPGNRFLCKCGVGKFPPDYLNDVPEWQMLQGYASRMAMSPLYPSSKTDALLHETMVSFMRSMVISTGGRSPGPSTGQSMLRRNMLGAGTCGACRGSCGPNGLRKCTSCEEQMYCSRKCQRAHWKQHKKECSKK